jgi:hypothetical protein
MDQKIFNDLGKALADMDKSKAVPAAAKADLKKALMPLLKEIKDSLDEEHKLATDIDSFKAMKAKIAAAEKSLGDRLDKLKDGHTKLIGDAKKVADVVVKYRGATPGEHSLSELFMAMSEILGGWVNTKLAL